MHSDVRAQLLADIHFPPRCNGGETWPLTVAAGGGQLRPY